MGTPYHISRSVSQRYGDKASAEFQALSLIAESLAHPDRTLLSAFIQQATDKDLASQFFLDEALDREEVAISEFLAGWIRLLRMGTFPIKMSNYTNGSPLVRPTISKDTDLSLERNVRRRDGDCCLVSMVPDNKEHNGCLLLVDLVPPTLFADLNMAQDLSALMSLVLA
jgi:hypothetical protein